MTNGDKIKEIFPQAEIIPQYVIDNIGGAHS